MPALADPTTWRTSPHHARGYLYIHKPAAIFKARLDAPDGYIYPTRELVFDGVTLGDYTDVLPGMTVLVGTTDGGDDLGRQRVKSSQPTFLEIGWTSIGVHDGELLLPDNAYITVINERRVWTKTPYISIATGEQFKDYDIGFDADLAHPPVANAGVGVCEFVDPDTGVITVTLDSTNSFPTNPLSVLGSVLWYVGDGTITVGVDTDQIIIVEFPPGFRYVSLTVTDDGMRSHTCYVPIFAAEKTGDNAPIYDFDAQINLTPEGAKASFTVRENIPTSVYPDGTLVMFWVDEYYGDTKGSLAGQAGREHMRFIGFIHTEPTNIQGNELYTQKDVTLECLDVAGKLAKLPGFPQVVKRVTSPANWYEMTGANMDRYLHYLLHWHSTALELADFYLSGTIDDYAFGSFTSDGANLYSQVDGRAQATGTSFRLTSDSQGIMRILPDPQLQETGDRTATVIVSLNEHDIAHISYRKQRPPRTHWIRASALKVTTSELTLQDVVFSIAPGAAPGQGETAQEIGNRLVQSQEQLNIYLGNKYARDNAPESPPDFELTRGGFAGIEPAHMEWVNVTTTSANAAPRGRVYDHERFLPLSASLRYDGATGAVSQSFTGEPEVVGQAASAYVPPIANLPGYTPSSEYFGEVTDTADTGFAPDPIPATLAAFADDGFLYLTSEFTSDSAPTWTQYDLGLTGSPTGMTADAFSPKYVGGGTAVNVWIATLDTDAARIYYVQDVFGGSPTVTLKFTSVSVPDTSWVNISSERLTRNFVVASWYTTSGVYIAYTTNNSTFTEVHVSSHVALAIYDKQQTPALAVVGGGVAYVGAYSSDGIGTIYKTTNSGASWSISHGTLENSLGFTIHIPFHNNPSKNKMWYAGNHTGGGTDDYHPYFYDGSTETVKGPLPGAYHLAPFWSNRAQATNPTNANQVVSCCLDRTTLYKSVYTSIDGGDDWTSLGFSLPYTSCDVDSAGNVYLWGFDGGIAYVAAFGTDINDRSGNLETDFTAGRIIGIAGG